MVVYNSDPIYSIDSVELLGVKHREIRLIIEREHGMYCLHKFLSCIFLISSHVLPTNYDSRIYLEYSLADC